ncbi:MAG: sulfotransferase domain-containing protein [Planctomycetes bacterium]|nr:sulfotransferase domain-containing protein [Planctomycetota bacterium]
MSALNSEIVIVSGLPRSGTSLMMQMLDRGGLPVVTDQLRQPDPDNPRGYYEYELVKKIKTDVSWLPATRGKAFKMVSQLLYHLPDNERYRILIMERDLNEMLDSQEKMLRRLGQAVAPREVIRPAFESHLQNLHAWLDRQTHMRVLRMGYSQLVTNPDPSIRAVGDFLGIDLDSVAMRQSIDPALYRNRQSRSETGPAL